MNNQLPATKLQYHRESPNTNNQSPINIQSPMTGAWLLVFGYLLVIDVWLLVITRL